MVSILTSWLSVFSMAFGMAGCGHQHEFTQKVTDAKYIQAEATCEKAAQYYLSCECGEHGEETFAYGKPLEHSYTASIESEEYLKTPATCQTGAEYYKSCELCGKKSYTTFFSETLGEHVFNQKKATKAYLKEEATTASAAIYYMSCECGAPGTETFEYGEKLREYTEEEKALYRPTSLTVTLYDTAESVYGFTYNTQSSPLLPVIQIAQDSNFVDYVEYSVFVEKATSYAKEGSKDIEITYYVSKAEIELEESTTYTYRVYDKRVGVGTDLVTFTTKDLSATKFTFAHLSDSQMTNSTGENLGKVLANVMQSSDFVVHTGDLVEWSKYESEWEDMLHDNFEYFSKIPVMAISGNHETTYQNGKQETYKHFNHNIPEQNVDKGYYYSFTYGNAKFIMLNTNKLDGEKLTQEQYTWLVNELQNNTATWTIVAMHNPMYSVGNYGANPDRNSIALSLRQQLQSLFAEYGVDVVLQGHDHAISRTFPINKDGEAMQETWQDVDGVSYSVDPNGVLYVMNGPSGTQSREPYAVDNTLYHYAQASNARSWAEFAIDGNKMVVTVKYTDGTTTGEYQEWGIIKTA